MPAGLNAQMRVWRMANVADDDVGGALISGSVAYDCVACRFTPLRASQLLLEQGLETERLGTIITRPDIMLIYERDVIEITAPTFHANYGQRFRILDAERTGMHAADRRGFMYLTVSRYDRARSEANM
jgi:hypothetical protein